LHLMITRDLHPILHYGMVYLLQAAGVTDIALLRSINLLGLPLVIFAVAYGFRLKLINLSQALIVWVLFASSPIFFEYFAELRSYFLLYAASIATSILWYVLMRQIDAGQNVSATTISIWGACLAIFVNLHYFATILGGMLTAVLLMRLAIRGLWSKLLVIAVVSLVAAAPALVLGALQEVSTPKGLMSWIKTSPIESIKMSVRMVEGAAARNLAAVACAVVTCLFILEDWRKWVELRTPVILLGVIAFVSRRARPRKRRHTPDLGSLSNRWCWRCHVRCGNPRREFRRPGMAASSGQRNCTPSASPNSTLKSRY